VAHRVISLPRSNPVAFAAKRTLNRSIRALAGPAKTEQNVRDLIREWAAFGKFTALF